jgi:ABC transporter substrate binding protein
MRRREFTALLSASAVPWPLVARAQQPAMPVVGYLNLGPPETSAATVAAFRKGLSEAGYVEGQNVAIEYRWALNDSNRLSELAADLVRRRVSVIVAIGALAALAAKAAAATIPNVLLFRGHPALKGLDDKSHHKAARVHHPSRRRHDLTLLRHRCRHRRAEGLVHGAEVFAGPQTVGLIVGLRMVGVGHGHGPSGRSGLSPVRGNGGNALLFRQLRRFEV